MPEKGDSNLKHEIDFSIKHNEILGEHTKKTRLANYCPNTSMETIFMNAENSKTNKPHKFVPNLLQRLDLRSLNKHVALQHLSIYYTLENIKKLFENKKLKTIAAIRNDEFELLEGSYSVFDIQDYIEYITKKHEILSTNPYIEIYINRIKNRVIFEIKNDINYNYKHLKGRISLVA